MTFKRCFCVMFLVLLSACGASAPTAPAPTTGILIFGSSADCIGKVARVDLSIDGTFRATGGPGGTIFSGALSIGNHTLDSTITALPTYKNGATSTLTTVVNVPATGATVTPSCAQF